MEDEGRPADRLSVTRLETLKVLADPLRQQLIDLLRREPATVKQLAETLDLGPKKLYYHINLLLEHGLIRVVGTRVVSGILERQYRATAYLFLLDEQLMATSPLERQQNREILMSTVLELTRNDIRNSARSGLLDLADDAPATSSLFLEWEVGHMTAEQARSFYQRVEELCKEFPVLQTDIQAPEVRAYRLLVTLFPTASHTHLGETEGEEDAHA